MCGYYLEEEHIMWLCRNYTDLRYWRRLG